MRAQSLATVAVVLVVTALAHRPVADWAFLGVVLGAPMDTAVVEVRQCWTGREFALDGGSYDITTDDTLLNVPHEHGDSSAVLFALDSVRVCAVGGQRDNFSALVTLVRDSVSDIHFAWLDADTRPTLDSLIVAGTAAFGPFWVTNEHGVTIWDDDDVKVWMYDRNPFSDGPSVVMSDRAACSWFEGLVHTKMTGVRYTDDDANYC